MFFSEYSSSRLCWILTTRGIMIFISPATCDWSRWSRTRHSAKSPVSFFNFLLCCSSRFKKTGHKPYLFAITNDVTRPRAVPTHSPAPNILQFGRIRITPSCWTIRSVNPPFSVNRTWYCMHLRKCNIFTPNGYNNTPKYNEICAGDLFRKTLCKSSCKSFKKNFYYSPKRSTLYYFNITVWVALRQHSSVRHR